MSKAKWREVGIFNAHMMVRLYAEETGGKGVYFGNSVNDGSRTMIGTPDGWIIRRPGFCTNPDYKAGAARMRDQNKVFYAFGDRDKALAEAVEWVENRYGLHGAVAIPGFGRDRFPTEIAEWAKRKVKTLS